MIDPGIKQKVALVTGGNHGIGAATAVALAALGVKVFITFYREPSRYSETQLAAAMTDGIGGDVLYRARQQQSADHVVTRIESIGGLAIAQEANLATSETIPTLFDRCEAEFGQVDILVNNHTYCVLETFDPALVSAVDGIEFITSRGIDRHMTVNARAYALLMAEYIKRYLKRGGKDGRIINISTDAAHAHTANVSYAASKHAIESYTRSAAAELGKYGVTVNCVAPGPVQTGYIPPQMAADIAAQTPLRRVGEPEDIADVVVFLASQQARWLTGQLIYVGGGWRMHQ